MSAYRMLRTQFTSRYQLRQALQAAGVEFEECQPGTERHLVGYQGDKRPETATFIIPRFHVGAMSNEVGYHWDPAQRCFTEIVSEYDSRQRRCTEIRQAVKREYACGVAVQAARAKGYRVQRNDRADG